MKRFLDLNDVKTDNVLPVEDRVLLFQKGDEPQKGASPLVVNVFTDGSVSGNGKQNATGGIGIHFPNGQLPDVSIPFYGRLDPEGSDGHR